MREDGSREARAAGRAHASARVRQRRVGRTLVAVLLASTIAAAPASAAAASDTWAAGGRGAATALANVLYIPAKLAYALVGGVVGGLAFAVTAGNMEVANTIWRPSVGGRYTLSTEDLFPSRASGGGTGQGVSEYQPQWPE